MQLKSLFNSRLVTVAAGATLVGLIGAGAGYSAAQITSGDIANNTVRSKDVKDGNLKTKDLSKGTVKKLKGQTGPQGPAGTSGTATYAGPNWSIVDRNVEENGDAYLRSGPGTPPKGIGSLGLRTGSGGVDKAAFGNEKDFLNQTLASITTLKYSVFATGEDIANNVDNAPNLAIEVDPSGPTNTAGLNFSTLVYTPAAPTANAWTNIDTAAGVARWRYTGDNPGQAGAVSGCNQVTYCTLAQAKAAFPTATVFTVQITKGRDFEFSGAVDALVVNAKTYDFEPFGVTSTP